MIEPLRDTSAMIRGMQPELRPGIWVFASGPAAAGLAGQALASMAEDEGLSLVLPQPVAAAAGLDSGPPMAWIVLRVHSALDGTGLTAAVATALAAEGIACNIIAALRHDHVFVPLADAGRALAALQRRAAAEA